jgi:hypothetical protein
MTVITPIPLVPWNPSSLCATCRLVVQRSNLNMAYLVQARPDDRATGGRLNECDNKDEIQVFIQLLAEARSLDTVRLRVVLTSRDLSICYHKEHIASGVITSLYHCNFSHAKLVRALICTNTAVLQLGTYQSMTTT